MTRGIATHYCHYMGNSNIPFNTHVLMQLFFDGLVSCVLIGFFKGFFVNVTYWFKHVMQGTSAIFALHEKQRAS